MAESQSPHVAILPSPGMGHLIPLAELAKRLVLHNISVTFLTASSDSSPKVQKAIVDALPKGVQSIPLQPISLDDLPPETKPETLISLTVTRSLPSLRHVLKTLKSETRLVALIVDHFSTHGFDVAEEFGISPYVFNPIAALGLALFLHLPTLDARYTCEYRDLTEPVKLPGCIPVHGKDLPDPVQDRKNESYKWILHHSKNYKRAKSILVNTFDVLEPGATEALKDENAGNPPVYVVGPLVQTGSQGDNSECLRWLDEQPGGSVLYVSFGSGGTLSDEQLNELALGLEMSEQRFLWVVRSPQRESNSAYFSVESVSDPFHFLPEGFIERTKDVGLVVPSWAPQIQVLSHEATGGFLTHCGWNSTLESVVHGVPLIAWPLYAEQKMNAVMLVEDMQVALRPKANEIGLIGKEEVARVVRGLMEGEQGIRVKSRMRGLKDAAVKAMDADGSSSKALSELAHRWKCGI